MPCSNATCPPDPIGIATTMTAMANTPMERRSTVRHRPALAAADRRARPLSSSRPDGRGGAASPWHVRGVRECGRPAAGADLGQRDIPERELFLGRPSGSAMPLVWAHAEHIKLLRSLRDGAVFDMPVQTWNRYVKNKPAPAPQSWRLASRLGKIDPGRLHRLETLEAARVRWSADNWASVADSDAKPTGLGSYICDLPTQSLRPGSVIRFTFFWTQRNVWQGENFDVTIGNAT